MEALTAAIFRFGEFELDCGRRTLKRSGQPLTLNSKTFDLLQQLVENHGSIMSKDDLMDRVWPDQFVEENNLTVQISALRKVFGNKAGSFRYITTVPGKGYSFIEAVERLDIETPKAVNTALAITRAENFYDTASIFGRANEIAEIKSLLRDGDNAARLIVLTGAGGSGKTKLARTVAAEITADFPDGVFFVELAAVHNVELVALTVAKALGLSGSGDTAPIDLLKAFLRERRVLLVLDNFEQLTSAAPIVNTLLASTHSIKVVITSRVALRLKNEWEFAVLPLSVPPRDIVLSAEQLKDYAAIRLFAARAQAVKSSFSLTSDNTAAVAGICLRLDGLPLAIELAAARIRLLTPQSILARLEHSLDLLTGGAHDLPEHQRTIRGTIEWSYDLLDDAERSLFRRLAVFAGGFTIEAAEAIAKGGSKGSEADAGKRQAGSPSTGILIVPLVLDLLTSLLDNNLLVSKEQADGGTRLQMLEVVREFAFEQLEKNGDAGSVQHSHSDLYLALAEEAEPHLFSGQSIDWLEKLETENDNIRAALQWQLDNEPESAARTAAALGQFWINRSHLAEARRWLEAALKKGSSGPATVRFKLLNTFSLVARHQGDYEATRRASEESLAASRAANDLPQIILSCHAVAALETREGNFGSARDLILEALSISRELGDEKQVAFTLSFLSNLFLAEGNAAAARMPIEESLEISRRLGFKVNVSINLTNLGTVAYYEGETEAAQQHFAESFAISWEMGNKILVSCCLDGAAAVAAKLGDPRRAACLAGAADGLRETIGYEIELTEQLFRDKYLAKLRSEFAGKTFEAFYLRGKSIDLDAAAALAFGIQLPGSGLFPSSGTTMEEDLTEIIIESRTFERIVIDEEIDNSPKEH